MQSEKRAVHQQRHPRPHSKRHQVGRERCDGGGAALGDGDRVSFGHRISFDAGCSAIIGRLGRRVEWRGPTRLAAGGGDLTTETTQGTENWQARIVFRVIRRVGAQRQHH